MSKINKSDVIVIGAGAVGSASAYFLARAGKKVTVIERKDSCMGTGGATGGLLSWFTKKPGFHLDLFLRSKVLFPVLRDELEGDIGLQYDVGTLQIIENELEYDLVKQSMLREDIPQGFHLEMLDHKQLHEVEPYMSDHLENALLIPESGYIDVFKYIYTLVANAKRLGAVFHNETSVTGLIQENGRVVGVHSDKGDFYADAVVNCAGTWGGQIAAMLGFDLPIKPRRGQIVAMEPCGPRVMHMITSSSYQTVKFHPELITDETIKRTGYTFALEQSDAGTILINGTREFADFDKGISYDGIRLMIQGAAKVYPCLKDMQIMRMFAGLRPYTPDGLPIVGQLPGVDGFIMACGHEGDGIALSAITGSIVSELVCAGQASFDISPLSAQRFL